MAARLPRKPPAPKTIDALRHGQDHRSNIPTAETQSLALSEEKGPRVVRYPRDPSLDPQLVWKGKDEQDGEDLTVPAVPIYIQEQISPKAIIEDLRAQTASGRDTQLDLFESDFNGMEFDQRIDFYRHPMKWSNRMILGDSLLVMTSLAEKEGLKGQVQTIYLDPPYGIKFGSNWQVSTRKRDVRDGKSEDATRQPEQVRAFRDTWELGIHSYLSYLRDRLAVVRELLTESGSIFVQIGDENVHLVRAVLDEVMGSGNFCGELVVAKASAQSSALVPGVSDFILWYARDANRVKFRRLFAETQPFDNPTERYVCVETPDGEVIDLSVAQKMGNAPIPEGRICRLWPLFSQTGGASSQFEYTYEGTQFTAPRQYGWQTTRDGLDRLGMARRLHPIGKSLRWKVYHDQFPYKLINNVWLDLRPGGFGETRTYVVQTDTRVVARCLLMTTDPGDLVLDPTCGSGTTAYVAEQWGRRWITIDTSRVALALARTRLMSARYPYYVLADSTEGRRREAEATGHQALGPAEEDIRKGFVYQRVPHITLKSIVQNPEIAQGMSRAQIDATIARHAESEILFDRPFEDAKVVRVPGPFTVESLSPHRVVADAPEDYVDAQVPVEDAGRFIETILDNIRTSGVDNRVKGERLRFESLESFPGRFLQAQGTFSEGETLRRVAIAIGPQYGTVGPDLVREAVLEAGGYFDLLIVCGFAFDARADEESGKAQRFGRLTVLTVRMNPDLAMSDDLLKKTRAGNLFTVFGQPDIDIRQVGEHELAVEIRGLDVYDPTTGVVRSDTTDDIACWFLDTDYDDQQFFVRHAYFPGGDDPYEKLKRALRAEIDEAAWSSLASTVSRPFPRPSTGRIAVKVINHYGDEILKVYGA